MRIIIDFDYTIFDTELLRKQLIAAFTKQGISEAAYRAMEKRVITESPNDVYIFSRHLNLLARGNNNTAQQLHSAAEHIFQDTRSYVFPDAVTFLKQTSSQHDLYLLTFGDEEWQKRKIESSGIAPYIHRVHVTQQPKVEVIQEYIHMDAPIFIEDRGTTIDAVKQRFPQVHAIWLHRPGTPYYDEPSQYADEQHSAFNFTL